MSVRWLYHVALRRDVAGDGPYAPGSLAREGFVHASFRDRVLESARLYFPPEADVVILQIDPRRLGVEVEIATTPRGPMPHVHGAIPRVAIAAMHELSPFDGAPDEVADATT